jgi:hypothetical protein
MGLPELNLDACRALSAAHGLPLDFIVKEIRVFDALAQAAVFNAGEGNGELIFKGGTALNKIYFGGLQRFSEDLDFDLATARTKAKALRLFKRVANVMQDAGFRTGRIRRVGRREPSFQLECSFESPLGRRDYIGIDAAVKPAIAISDVVEAAVARSSFAERVVAGIRAYSLDGLVGRKMAALADRCEGKDVYDVANGLPLVGKEFAGAVRRMLASERRKVSAGDLFRMAADRLRMADYVELRNLTNPFIPMPLRPPGAGAWRAMAVTLAARLEELGKGARD